MYNNIVPAVLPAVKAAVLPAIGYNSAGVSILTLGMTSLPSYVTFTRASSATYFNSAGVMTTATTNEARFDYNPVTLQPRGLLMEGSRTNLFLNSATLSTQSVTVTAVAHTISFYGTGTITLSGASTAGPIVGTAANERVSLTFTPSAGSLTCTVTGSVTWANCEIGLFASSWIPTTGATATRAGDVATITNLANIGYNAAASTLLANYEIANGWVTPMSEQGIAAFSNGSTANRVQLTRASTGNISIFAADASVAQATFTDGGGVRSTPITLKSAIAFAASDYALCSTGLSAATSASGTVPTMDRLHLGARGGGGVEMYGWLRGLNYYPSRLANATLQGIVA